MKIVISDIESWLPELIMLSEQAGAGIVDLYEKGDDLKIIQKGDGSPVTNADHHSHYLLEAGLKELAPGIPVISEEDEASWSLKSPLYWLIDPLDGTKGFIERNGEFCINVALMEDDKPILGIIHVPLTQETFYGYGSKAFRKHVSGASTPLHTRKRPPEGATLLLSSYDFRFEEERAAQLKDFPLATIEQLHSAIKFCHIAAGEADIYLRFVPCKEWDTAAGQILVEAAGGVITTLEGTPFLYGKPGLKNGGFKVFGQKP